MSLDIKPTFEYLDTQKGRTEGIDRIKSRKAQQLTFHNIQHTQLKSIVKTCDIMLVTVQETKVDIFVLCCFSHAFHNYYK